MSETSVSAPWMKKMRQRLPNAEIIKHHDASMIGLLDCSITHNDHIWWAEFKLFTPPVKWSYPCGRIVDGKSAVAAADGEIPYEKIAAESSTQFALAKRLARAARTWYIFWVNKTRRVDLWDPILKTSYRTSSTDEMVELFISKMNNGPVMTHDDGEDWRPEFHGEEYTR